MINFGKTCYKLRIFPKIFLITPQITLIRVKNVYVLHQNTSNRKSFSTTDQIEVINFRRFLYRNRKKTAKANIVLKFMLICIRVIFPFCENLFANICD